jgi:hypothetical protein
MMPPCPSCALAGTFAYALGSPEPGDLVICLACSEICIYTVSAQLRPLTFADLPHYDLGLITEVVRNQHELRDAYARRN